MSARQTAAQKKAAEADATAEQPEVQPPPQRPRPQNVIEALAQVQERIGGIAKLTPTERKRLGMTGGTEEGSAGIKYAYRGIDQVTAAAQPLFGELGIVIAPGKILSSTCKTVLVGANRSEWDHITLVVRWSIYGPGGIDDMIEAETIGEGRDNSDKTANKAYTAAYKNLMLKLLTIGDPSEDPDNERHDNVDMTVDEVERIRAEEAHVKAETERQARLEEVWPKFAEVGSTSRGALLQETARAAGLKLTKKDMWANPAYQARLEWVMAADNDQVEIALAEIRGQNIEPAPDDFPHNNPEGVEPGDLDPARETT